MNKKFFVLDTNILLNSPNALSAFDDNVVILTEAVLEELDSFKKDKNDLGVSARLVTRKLEDLRVKGSLLEGVSINNGLIKIETNHNDIELPPNWTLDKADHRILQICKALQNEGKTVRLVTNDILLRIKSDIIGIQAEGFFSDQAPQIHDQYTGRLEVYIDDVNLQLFYQNGELSLKEIQLFNYDNQGNKIIHNSLIYPHEFLLLRSPNGSTALGKVDERCLSIKKLKFDKFYPYGIIPKNVGQQFIIEALMDDTPLAIIKGPSGSAKTLLSIACGLEYVTTSHKYRKILLCRPTIGLGGDNTLGYLPGTEREKIDPYIRSCYDNLEILVDSDEKERYSNEDSLQSKLQYILNKNYIEFQAISFLRGRSITKQYMLIDEAQNVSSGQMKAIITRIGEGTKLILCGDPNQVDTPFLDSTNNGLSWVSEKMKGSPYCVQLTLQDNECVRSALVKDILTRI